MFEIVPKKSNPFLTLTAETSGDESHNPSQPTAPTAEAAKLTESPSEKMRNLLS